MTWREGRHTGSRRALGSAACEEEEEEEEDLELLWCGAHGMMVLDEELRIILCKYTFSQITENLEKSQEVSHTLRLLKPLYTKLSSVAAQPARGAMLCLSRGFDF